MLHLCVPREQRIDSFYSLTGWVLRGYLGLLYPAPRNNGMKSPSTHEAPPAPPWGVKVCLGSSTSIARPLDMSNVFNFILKGEESGDENGDGKKLESSAQEANTTSVPLSRDEMRAKRLGKLVDPALLTENEEGSGAESAKKVDSTAKEVAGAAKIDYVSPVSLKKASEKDRGNFVGQNFFSDPALSAVESSEKTLDQQL